MKSNRGVITKTESDYVLGTTEWRSEMGLEFVELET